MVQPTTDYIVKKYRRRLIIPEGAQSKPQFALCVIGLVGSGKTTTLKRLCESIPMVRVSGDEIREVLRGEGLPYDDPNTVISTGHELTAQLKKAGYNIAHDNDFSNPVAREALSANNQKYDVREIWIRMRPPEEWIIAKLRQRPPSGTFATAEDAIAGYFARKELQSRNSWVDHLPFIYEFDPSQSDFHLQIQEGVQRIREALRKA